MMHIRNNQSYNELRWRLLSGNVTGIWDKNNFFLGSNSFPLMKFHYLTANFVNFEKYIWKHMPKLSYHLSGYGVKFNETLVSFLGESTERYTYATLSSILKNHIVFSSYEELKEQYKDDLVCELQYVNTYYTEEKIDSYVLPTDKIQWLSMHSLIDLNKRVWMPLQFVTMYSEEMFTKEKRYVTSAVSTGTASHETMVQSVENALIEYLQIDSFNLWWYGGFKGESIYVDIKEELFTWFQEKGKVKKFIDNFNVTFTDISLDKSIYVVLCEIEVKDGKRNLPKYTVGVQGGYSLEKSVYRAFMECVTVLEYNMNIPWTNKDGFLAVNRDIKNITNLDDNVIYYAKFGKPELKYRENEKILKMEKSSDFKNLLQKLGTFSKYAAFLHVTPPGFKYMNLEVSRVIVPEWVCQVKCVSK